MSRLVLLLFAALGVVTSFAQPKAPNFLFIAIDDLKPILGHLSEEPNNFLSEIYPAAAKRAAIRQVLSPNLDRLSAQGVAFRHAYCPAPLRNPSRTATMIGIAIHHSGITANAELYDQRADPREHTNRIDDPSLKAVRDAMNGQLDQRIQAGPFAL